MRRRVRRRPKSSPNYLSNKYGHSLSPHACDRGVVGSLWAIQETLTSVLTVKFSKKGVVNENNFPEAEHQVIYIKS